MSGGLERRWRRSRLVPAGYDFAVEREWIARPAGRLLWGADVRGLYGSFGGAGRLAAGAAVLDVPCGGGVAFRGVPRDAAPRYVAADLSPLMLRRARAQARGRGLGAVLAQVSVDRLPFADETFDLCLSYNGLHCLPGPAGAVAEMARVLRTGGELRGSALVTGAGRRQDALIALLRRLGDFGPAGSAADLRGWLESAGLEPAELTVDGALACFSAVKAG